MKKYLLSLKIVGMIILLVLSGSYTLKTYGEEQGIITNGIVIINSVPSESADTTTNSESNSLSQETSKKVEISKKNYPKTREDTSSSHLICIVGILLLLGCLTYAINDRIESNKI